MDTSESVGSDGQTSATIGRPLPEFVDWLAAVGIALVGMALTVGGSVLRFVVDRESLEAGVESGQITVVVLERDLTRAEAVDFTAEVLSWTGIGLLVTGIGLLLFAVGYIVARHRAHQRTADGEAAGSYRSYAVLGAAATAVLSFVPLSPVLGGGVAGYLEQYETGRSVSVGALSGLLAMLPGMVVLLFVTVGMYAGLAAVQAAGFGLVVVSVMLFVLLLIGAYGAGLGAVGGFAGAYLAGR